jgi:membrane associated rhomboid family serine protease
MTQSWEDPPEYRGMPQIALPRPGKATRRLLIVLAAIYGISLLLFLFSAGSFGWVNRTLGLSPAAWRALFPFVPVWQLLTYGFLHSVGPSHLLLNALVLYFFGTMLEEILGTRRFVVAYFSAQFVGAVFFLVSGILRQEQSLAVGASGAVYGVMIAVATLRPRQMVLVLFIPISLGVLALGIVAITAVSAALQLKMGGGDDVAHLVHLGGIAYGFLAVRSRLIFADPLAALARVRATRHVERQSQDEARVDQILAKINREGMASLTRSEREFLKRVSSRR